MEVQSVPVQQNPLERVMDNLSPGRPAELTARKGGAKEKFDEQSVKDSVDRANTLATMFDRSLKFEYRKEADIYQVSVIDTAKDEVVRKIPPDEVVRFIENIKDLFGALLDVTL